MRPYGLRDDQWDRIKNLLPNRPGTVGVTPTNNRLFVEAVLHRCRTGIPWRDLPERCGELEGIRPRLSRWAVDGVRDQVSRLLAADADNECTVIDSTIVPAHQHNAVPKKDGTDQMIERAPWTEHQNPYPGRPTGTLAASSDRWRGPWSRGRGQTPAGYAVPVFCSPIRPFDTDERVIKRRTAAGKTVVNPSKANHRQPRKYARNMHAARRLIENLVPKLKQLHPPVTFSRPPPLTPDSRFYSAASLSSSSSLGVTINAFVMMPDWSRTLASTASAISGCSRKNCLAFSRPWPTRWLA